MAVVPMHRVSICALNKDRKAVLETIQRLGVVEIQDTKAPDELFTKSDTSASRAVFDKNVQLSALALEVLDAYAPEKASPFASLEGRQELSLADYDVFGEENSEVMRVAYRLVTLSKEIAEKKAETIKLESQIEALTPWLALPVSLRYQGSRTTFTIIGAAAGELATEGILLSLAAAAPAMGPVQLDLVSSSKEQTCVMATCLRADAAALEEAMRSLGFARPASPPRLAPAMESDALKKQVRDNTEAIAMAENEIKTYAGVRRALRFMIDFFTLRTEKYAALDGLLQTRHAFVLTGYIPAPAEPLLQERLEHLFGAVAIEFTEPDPKEDVPVLLKNNSFAAPVEGVLESFSLPGRGELDPTSLMSFFYYFLFGLMLSDAGYGLLLTLACGGLLLKFKKMEQGMKRSLQMFMYCGISTTLWGIVFSSYFGDVVNIVSKTFFGKEVGIPPLWFSPIEDPMRMLMFSLAIGVAHLFFGLGVKLYALCRVGKYKDALYDVVFWYLLVGGLIVVLLSTQLFVDIAKLTFLLPPLAGNVGMALAGVGAVGIILTGGRESKSPVKRLLKGLYALYNVTGYLSDILSYSRLLALGLATGVIASVVNQMGAMGGNSVSGVILFVIVFLAGQAINFGIELLGAYVHTNRLQFVEYFGKFYEGGGRKFTPFAINTKYFKFKEELNNG